MKNLKKTTNNSIFLAISIVFLSNCLHAMYPPQTCGDLAGTYLIKDKNIPQLVEERNVLKKEVELKLVLENSNNGKRDQILSNQAINSGHGLTSEKLNYQEHLRNTVNLQNKLDKVLYKLNLVNTQIIDLYKKSNIDNLDIRLKLFDIPKENENKYLINYVAINEKLFSQQDEVVTKIMKIENILELLKQIQVQEEEIEYESEEYESEEYDEANFSSEEANFSSEESDDDEDYARKLQQQIDADEEFARKFQDEELAKQLQDEFDETKNQLELDEKVAKRLQNQ